MTQLVVFNDENNEENSLLSCDVPSFDQDPNPAAQLEEALQKISAPCSFAELPLSDDQFPWEPESRFSASLTDFLLSDQVSKFDLDSPNRNFTVPCEHDAPTVKMNDISASSDSTPYRQMDLSPRSVVDISNPSATTHRSPYCIIRSSHSATAAAAAATAAMIVNDDTGLAAARSSSTIFDLQQSSLSKRPRIHEDSESELLSSTSMKSHGDDNSDAQTSPPAKSELELLQVPPKAVTPKPKEEKVGKGSNGRVALKAINIGKPGPGIRKDSSLKTGVAFVEVLTKEEQSIIERARQCRAEALVRFRKKKAIRTFGRRVRYECRKRIATTRPRVNGRFAKKSDIEALQKS